MRWLSTTGRDEERRENSFFIITVLFHDEDKAAKDAACIVTHEG